MGAAVSGGLVRIDGNAARLQQLFGMLDEFAPQFEIVEPRKPRP